jgi:hypothetical protein
MNVIIGARAPAASERTKSNAATRSKIQGKWRGSEGAYVPASVQCRWQTGRQQAERQREGGEGNKARVAAGGGSKDAGAAEVGRPFLLFLSLSPAT